MTTRKEEVDAQLAALAAEDASTREMLNSLSITDERMTDALISLAHTDEVQRLVIESMLSDFSILKQRMDVCCPEEPVDPPDEPPSEDWRLIQDVAMTGKGSDGWSGAYEAGRTDSQGPRLRENVEFVDGLLHIHTRPYTGEPKQMYWNGGPTYVLQPGEFASGGLSLPGFDLKPGTAWEIEAGQVRQGRIRLALGTWVKEGEGHWPAAGEIDFFEAGGDGAYGTRSAYKISSWYKDPNAPGDGRAHHEKRVDGDLTEWHTYRVEWLGGELRFYVDGDIDWTLSENIPTATHQFFFQTALEGGPKAKLGTQASYVEVRALRIYEATT